MTMLFLPTNDDLSNHERMAALATVTSWNLPGRHMVVPPEGEGLDVDDAVLYVHKGQVSGHHGEASIDVLSPIPYGTPGVLVVGYLYRDASNYKQHGTVAIQGAFSRRDLGVLMAALTLGDDGCFIPSQIGWDDLQPGDSDGGDDHVWHEATDITWRPTGSFDATWDVMEPVCLARLAQGYDLLEAMARFEHSW